MAWGFDTGGAAGGTAVSSLSITNITLAGTDRCLNAFGSCDNGTGNDPSTISYAGTSFTANVVDNYTQSYTSDYVWYLVAPSTSANQTLAMTLTGSSDEVCLTYADYTGIDQTTPIGTVGTRTAYAFVSSTHTSMSATVASSTGNVVVSACAYISDGTGNTITEDAGQTQRAYVNAVGSYHNAMISDEAGATSVTSSYTVSNPYYGNIEYIWEMNAASGSGGGTTILQLAGGGGLAGPSGLAGPGGLAG